MATNRGSTRVALVVLAAAVVAGLLAMHVPFLVSLGLSGAHAGMHASTAAVSSGHAMAGTEAAGSSPQTHSSTDPASAAPVSAASASAPMSMSISGSIFGSTPTQENSTVAGGAEQLCHADPAGHGSPTSAHAASCDLSAPPLTSASALGAAALVAVVMLALLAVPSRSALGGWWQRRGPPAGDRLHLSLCVIRV